MAKDWQQIDAIFLNHADPKVVLDALDDLVTIIGEGKYAVDHGFQAYHGYRHITKNVHEAARPLIKQHKNALKAQLKMLVLNAATKKRAEEVLKSAKYYKVL